MRRRVASFLLALIMALGLFPVQAFALDPAEPFRDVKEGDWCYEAVRYVNANGIFYGSNAMFRPQDTMTRGMFMTVLGRMAGVDMERYRGASSFSDVPESAYYAPYVAWATRYGIAGGYANGTFAPHEPVSRQQMAAFFVRYFEAFGVSYETGANVASTPADIDSVSPYARDAVLKLWRQGLLNGDGVNFNPARGATRAQTATICYRADRAVETWYQEPGVPSERVKIDPATGEPYVQEDKTPETKPSTGGGSSGGSHGGGGSSGGGTTTRYYQVTFALGSGQEGMTLPASRTYAANTQIGALPTPTAIGEGKVFLGWYYDEAMSRPAKQTDTLTGDVTLYAKIGDGASVRETETPNYIAAQDLPDTFQLKLGGTYQAGGLSIMNVTANNANVTFTVDGSGAVTITGIEGVDFEDKTRPEFSGRWNPGDTYKAVLADGSSAVFIDRSGVEQALTIRTYNFTIARAEVKSLELDSGLKYIPKSETSGMSDGLEGLFQISLEQGTDGQTRPVTKVAETGSFTYDGSETIRVGDTVAIYDGRDPRGGDLTDSDRVAYVEITTASGTTYGYKTAETEDVLFTPDILPVSSNKKTTEGSTLTLTGDDMAALRTDLAKMGLDANISVDEGDFIAFYSGNLEDNTRDAGNKPEYGKITNVTTSGDGTYTVTYANVSENDVLTAMDIYTKEEKEIALTDAQKEAIEDGIAAQAEESGFLDAAARELTALALETGGFQELAGDFDLESYAITFADGTPAGPEDLALMAGAKAEITKKEIAPKIHIGGLDHFDGSNGIRVELVMDLTIDVTGAKGSKLTIELQAAFEQEVVLSVNASGGAIWKWKFIFPYIYDYRLNANIDVGTYTGIGITATAKTASPEDDPYDWKPASGTTAEAKIIDIGKQITELMKEKDKFMGKDLVGGDDDDDDDDDGGIPISGGLAEKYAAMIEDAGEDASWIEIFKYEIFAKEGSVDPFHILCYGISADFVVKANFYVTLGMTFEFGAAKRYNFSIMLFHKECTNETIDLETPHYRFAFYVMGTMGVKAGVEFEIGVGLFSLKLDSIGICAEAGAYAQMWGYFYYEATWEQGKGKDSQYSGAMLIEIGAYLEISFKAQLFSSKKLTYQPTIYEHQWPILTVGEQENVFDFAEYDDSGNEIALEYAVQSATTLALPSALFSMQYLDLQSGETGGGKDDGGKMQPGRNCDDAAESHFTITMSDPHYTYDPKTNTVTISPEGRVQLPDCTMTIRWKNGTLAFTSQPIERAVTISWTDPVNARYIAFDSQGGSLARSIYAVSGDPIDSAGWPAPTKTGYDFAGWYTAAIGGTRYPKPDTMPDFDPAGGVKGVALYAHWTPRNDTRYTVEHYQEELNGAYRKVDTETKTGTTDARVNVEDLKKTTYTGFACDHAGERSYSIAPNGSTVVKLYYARNKCAVTFSYGMSGAPEDKTYTAKYGATVYAPMLALKGYEFGSFDPAVGNDKAVTVTGDAVYTARWTPRDDTPYRVEHYAQRVSGENYLLFSGGVENRTGTTGAQIAIDGLKRSDPGFTCAKAEEASYTIASDGATVVRLYYDRVTSVLTLDPDGGTLSGGTTMSLRFGAPITAGTPAKTGYTFAGWSYIRDGAEVQLRPGDTMPAHALTLTAKWTARGDIAYKVEHYCQDADSGDYYTLREVEDLTGAVGAEVTATAKTYEHYHQNDDAGGTIASGTVAGDGSLTLKLYYALDTVTVTFDPDGGTIAGGETAKTFRYGQSFSAPEVTRTGYGFDGWFDDGGTKYDSSTKVTGGVTLTAKWTAGGVNYTVGHYLMDLDGRYPAAASYTDTASGKTGDTITLDSLTRRTDEGFTFDATQTGSGPWTVAADGSTVVKLYYSRNQYTLTWELDGGTASGDHTRAGQIYYGTAITPPTVTKTGHAPAWSDVPATMPASDVTGTVTWTPNSRKVTFQPNGGEGTAQEVTFTYGQTNTAPTFTWTGYTLTGWSTSDTSTTAVDLGTLADTETTDVTLYAIWEADEYTITYVLDGGTNADGNPATYTPADTIALADPTKTGYTFLGWYTDAACTNKVTEIPAGSTGNKTFYAKWEAATYTVTFELNGGAMTGDTTATYSVNVTYDLPTPTREHYRFMGWYDNSSCNGSPLSKFSSGDINPKTLYAGWLATVTMDYQLLVDWGADGAVITDGLDKELCPGDTLPTDLGDKGYLIGWYSDNGGSTEVTSVPNDATGSYTVYLHCIPKTIKTAAGLKALGEIGDLTLANARVITLGANIDLSSEASWAAPNIGENITIDGAGLTITAAGSGSIFGAVGGTVKDLNVAIPAGGVTFTQDNFASYTAGSGTSQDNGYTAGLVASSIERFGCIENVHVGGGSITITAAGEDRLSDTLQKSFGGIVGFSRSDTTAKNCTVGDSVSAPLRVTYSGSRRVNIGGIVGRSRLGTIEYTKDCTNYVVISCSGTVDSLSSFGGIVASMANGTFTFKANTTHTIHVRFPESGYRGTIIGSGSNGTTFNDPGAQVTAHSNVADISSNTLSHGWSYTQDSSSVPSA